MPDEILTAAVEIARTAGVVAEARFRAGSPVSRKADGTEVTPADVEVERLIRAAGRAALSRRPGLRRGGGRCRHRPCRPALDHRPHQRHQPSWLDAGVIAGHPMGYEDMAPLPVLITEAGGRVSDLAGGDLLAGAGDVLTRNGHLHDQLVELVAGLPTGLPARIPDASPRALLLPYDPTLAGPDRHGTGPGAGG